jgi:hypothetical protein
MEGVYMIYLLYIADLNRHSALDIFGGNLVKFDDLVKYNQS